jgi:hypothetical protein
LAGNANESTDRPSTRRDNRIARTVGAVAAILVDGIIRAVKRNGLRHSVESRSVDPLVLRFPAVDPPGKTE